MRPREAAAGHRGGEQHAGHQPGGRPPVDDCARGVLFLPGGLDVPARADPVRQRRGRGRQDAEAGVLGAAQPALGEHRG
ncbi:hypothetical protein EAS64_31110 [Trebonia kvetii]|uniref:Uncharacterized protein n=1 Tax=Trebonia kvetii TaxID=2480626 RepID=A0A6P2BU47_9ACTN|nr:hypothetical protein [Trebonia kvetii]TVZ01891.1 hypothetical protein EAS64_31110 [Trebonia kvetii]